MCKQARRVLQNASKLSNENSYGAKERSLCFRWLHNSLQRDDCVLIGTWKEIHLYTNHPFL